MSGSWWTEVESREGFSTLAASRTFAHMRLHTESRSVPAELLYETRQEERRQGRKILAQRRRVGFDTAKVRLLADRGLPGPQMEPAIHQRPASLAIVRDAINTRYRLDLCQKCIRFNDSMRLGNLAEGLAAAEDILPVLPRVRELLSEAEWRVLKAFLANHGHRLPRKKK